MVPTKSDQEQSMVVLRELLDLLGLQAETIPKEDDKGVTICLKADEPGEFIGRKGHFLHSLELILNRVLRKKTLKFPWVEIEVDGYERRNRRRPAQSDEDRERLTGLALDAAKEVKRWGKLRRVGPLNARDRRVVHLALVDDAEVETVSEADEGHGLKRVTIRLVE